MIKVLKTRKHDSVEPVMATDNNANAHCVWLNDGLYCYSKFNGVDWQYLNDNKIGTRLLFGGNITKQPYFIDYKIKYRIVNNLSNTDLIMNNTFWIGIHPLIGNEEIDIIYKAFESFFEK